MSSFFRWLYIYLSGLVRLRTFRLSATGRGTTLSAGVHARAGRMWQSQMSIIKTPDRNGLGMWMTSWAGILGYFEKKAVTWDLEPRRVQLGLRGARAPVVGSDRTVSIVKILCLSTRVENLKVKKVIKVSYLNQESRQCFVGFLCMWTFLYIRNFTYPYHSYITGVNLSIAINITLTSKQDISY